jgi:hypothetical protein
VASMAFLVLWSCDRIGPITVLGSVHVDAHTVCGDTVAANP